MQGHFNNMSCETIWRHLEEFELTIFPKSLAMDHIDVFSLTFGGWICDSIDAQSKEFLWKSNHSLWLVRIQGQFGDEEKLLGIESYKQIFPLLIC